MLYKVICKRACTTPGYNRRMEYSISKKNHRGSMDFNLISLESFLGLRSQFSRIPARTYSNLEL